MSGWPKKEYEIRSARIVRAFTQTARELKEDDFMRKAMGSLAWGRHDAERGPGQDTLRDAVTEYGHLHGRMWAFRALCSLQNRQDVMRMFNDLVRE